MIYLTIGLVVCLFLLVLFILMHSESKNEVFRLTKTNNLLTEEITYYKAGNAQLSYKINEFTNFENIKTKFNKTFYEKKTLKSQNKPML